MIRRACARVGAALLLAGAAQARAAAPSEADFQAATRSLFEETCSQCHGPADADGGFDVTRYATLASLAADREGWERILQKLRSGEMPPSGVERRQDRIDALVRFLETELARADDSAPPDSGRVTLRRLNRAEYTNTIRDLLALEFRADETFPADDTGDGFDNIGDVLTVSPILMEKYLTAAEHIARRALAIEPLPKPIKIEYAIKFENLRKVDASTVEVTHHVDYDAEYDLIVGMPGVRPAGSKPVTLALWVDGALVSTRQVETAPPPGPDPYSEQSFHVALTEGDHRLRAGFVRDEFIQSLPVASLYERKANKYAGALTVVGPFGSKQPKASRQRVLTCDPKSGAACLERILGNLARRAYRRSVTPAEVRELTQFVDLVTADGGSSEQGLALALQAMLTSPHFLFHVERDGSAADPSQVHPISDVELASRLSYFIWSSMPDDELLTLAIRGQLSAPAALDTQVKRMLRDPKAAALGENFAGQWLEIRNLDAIRPDPDAFPTWGPELRDAMRTETELFFGSILRNNASIRDFIDSKYTFLNERLAEHYGIAGVRGPEFRRVALAKSERGGVLSQASVLAVSSYPTRTSVVLRGKYVLQNILGAPPPPPPPDVPALDERAVATSASLREQMALHRESGTCSSCHARMDPLGFGLENFDAIGRFRMQDGGARVDASGTLPSGESFATPAEMRRVLGGMLPEFARCLTEKMLTYALGRGLEPYDRPAVRAITQRLAASGYGLQTLVREIVKSLPFRARRAEAPRTAEAPRSANAAP